MNIKLLSALLFLLPHFIFSQSEKTLKGVVSSEDLMISGVDVINKTSEKSTRTNENGEFVISVKANDFLIFYSKNYDTKNIKVTPEMILSNNLKVKMFLKAVELEEVLVKKDKYSEFMGSPEYSKGKNDELAVYKSVEAIKKRTVYEGTIDNGMDFRALGEKIYKLIAKKKGKDKKEVLENEIKFSEVAKATCDEKFFTKTLKLEPEEIDLFLQFCNTDSKSIQLMGDPQVFSMMDFLIAKNIEFQKLKLGLK